MNTMLHNATTDAAAGLNLTDLNLTDLPPVTPARYAHLALRDRTHVAPLVPVLPARRKRSVDWGAGGVIVLLLSALATAVDLLSHLN